MSWQGNRLYKLAVLLGRWAFSLRYRLKVKGLDELNASHLDRPGGVLFLPNHTAMIDPALVFLVLAATWRPRPIAVEYVFRIPIVSNILRAIGAVALPNFDTAVNTLKQKQADRAFKQVAKSLQEGGNFLIFPSGRLKLQAREVIGGSSGLHRLLEEAPDTNVVLVRITGLWGSSLSRSLTGKVPDLLPQAWQGIKSLLGNLLFFTPRREVTLEFHCANKDFPFSRPRQEQNQFLEDWYNRYSGSQEPVDEPLSLVPFSLWTRKLPEVVLQEHSEGAYDLSRVSPQIREEILAQLSKMTKRPVDQIAPPMELARDLALDSLDVAELVVFLEERYQVRNVMPGNMHTVASALLAAVGECEEEGAQEEAPLNAQDLTRWQASTGKLRIPTGEGSIPRWFLETCHRFGDKIACIDGPSSTAYTYRQLKLSATILAKVIQRLPGERIGILLPATPIAYIATLAVQMAGKVPVMINWTVGRQYFDAIAEQADLKVILTSWKFIDRLDNVDLESLEDLLICLEDMKAGLSWKDRAHGWWLARRRPGVILRSVRKGNPGASTAVILFTSGTEAAPKGVPLSHQNILSDLGAALQCAQLHGSDILYGMLPPFHSFGFTVTGLMPLICGMRVVFSPNPMDSRGIARSIERWGVTLLFTAPTFLSRLLRIAEVTSLKTLRLVVVGAEKPPEDLVEKVHALGEGVQMIEGYGITECSPILTLNRPHGPHKGVGQPIPGVSLCVVDPETHELCPMGATGLILARGPNIFEGYWRQEKEVGFLLLSGEKWYNTGDLGHLDERNCLVLEGRLKRFVKIGGEMISLGAIEEALVRAAPERGWQLLQEGPSLAVCAIEEAGKKTRLVLVAAFDVSIDAANTSLRIAGFSNLARISSVYRLPALPLLGSGKVNYQQIAKGIHKDL